MRSASSRAGSCTRTPDVKYRGIFLNDENPDLTNWMRAKFGNVPKTANPNAVDDAANYGHEFYTKLFEVMLRLRANYLWPAMWNNAFNEDDPENARLADEYGIVMGTSHQEPMLRAQKEWDWRYEKTLGKWNYAKHPDVLQQFWREGVRRNKNFESIITMGLRGANDTEMAPGGPDANRALLEQIVDVQRDILREEVNPDLTQSAAGLVPLQGSAGVLRARHARARRHHAALGRGQLGQPPPPADRGRTQAQRAGRGSTIISTTTATRAATSGSTPIRSRRSGSRCRWRRQYGADRIWIVNVGHFKGYELPMEYFLSLAWDTNRWTGENTARVHAGSGPRGNSGRSTRPTSPRSWRSTPSSTAAANPRCSRPTPTA